MEKTPRTGPMAPDDKSVEKRVKTQPFVKETVKESLRSMQKKSIAPYGKRSLTGAVADAPITKPVKDEQPRELSSAEGSALLDRRARHYLNMSGSEFVNEWNAGTFKDTPETPGLVRVAMLLPLDRET